MGDNGNYDFNCGSCVWLSKRKYHRKTCSDRGFTEFNKACNDWEPDLEELPQSLFDMKVTLSSLSLAELKTVQYLVEDQEEMLKSGLPFKVGQWIYYKYRHKVFKIQVQNLGEEFVFGVTKDGRKFRVLPENCFSEIPDVKE